MTTYHILYYTWHEYTFHDCTESMRSLGCTVDIISGNMKNYDMDEIFMEQLKTCCMAKSYDFIFTFNYFPVIARVAADCKLPYISWIFDSPHYTLDSITLSLKYNRVFLFDKLLYEKYRSKGIRTVFHMPLAYNRPRLDRTLISLQPHYEHDITFLGSLYDDAYDFFDQIHYLPPYLKGYIHAIIDAQQQIYGADLCNCLFDHEKCKEMAMYVKVDFGTQYSDYRDDVFRNMIRKKITVLERRKILSMIGQKYNVDLYSSQKPSGLEIHYKGYADYDHQMPNIFYTSKINLNITLRSILSGIPLRVIDILGAHGFLLTNYQPEFTDYFSNHEDLVWYDNYEDLMDKIRFYLAHEKERERIAQNGNLKAQKYFTYHRLLQKIFDLAFETTCC